MLGHTCPFGCVSLGRTVLFMGEIMQFAEKLKNERAKTGLTQNQVADLLGIERSTYAKYECGTSKPSLDVLYKISLIYRSLRR